MMVNKVEVVGIDAGNGFTKTASSSGERVIESVFAQYANGKAIIGEAKDNVDVYIPRKLSNREYVLGAQAVSIGGIGGTINTLDLNNRLNRQPFQLLLQFALAYALPESTDTRVILVTGVPEGEDLQQSHAKYEALLNGINVISVNGVNQIRDVIKIDALHQPAGLLLDQYLDHDGYVRNEHIVSGDSLIVDIGEGTTDVSVFRGLKKLSGFTIKAGVSEVARRVVAEVNHYFRAVVHVSDVQAVARRQQGQQILTIGRDDADVSQEIMQAKQDVIHGILSEIQSRIPDRDIFARVLVGGGGAGFFETQIVEWLPDAIITPDQSAIARGFRKYGLALARQEGIE
jgi:hypothetical protein